MRIIYPDIEKLIEFHTKIIEIWLDKWEWWSFGFLWWKDKSDLQSIVDFIKSDLYYPNIEDKITHLFYSINKN
jgi:death-on-curing protein